MQYYWITSSQVVVSPVGDSEPSSPDGPGRGGEEADPARLNGHAPLRPQRSHTFTPATCSKTSLQESVSWWACMGIMSLSETSFNISNFNWLSAMHFIGNRRHLTLSQPSFNTSTRLM